MVVNKNGHLVTWQARDTQHGTQLSPARRPTGWFVDDAGGPPRLLPWLLGHISPMLRKEDIGAVFFGEEELAKSLVSHVLERFARQTAASTNQSPLMIPFGGD
jgi:hypothetical protein